MGSRKTIDPRRLCVFQAQEIGREFYRISQAEPGDQIHDAKRLHRHVLQALERFDYWLGRIDDPQWLDELWGPVFAYIDRSFVALEAHLAVYPDPDIARTVAAYRQTLDDLELNQTTPGVLELPFKA